MSFARRPNPLSLMTGIRCSYDPMRKTTMDEGWMVTMTVRMRVRGVSTREEAITSASMRMEDAIRTHVDIPYSVDAKRITSFDEEPLFGRRWY